MLVSIISVATLSMISITNSQGTSKVAGFIGSKVTDGNMAIQVKSVDCGAKSIGSGVARSTARGQFCIVTFSAGAAKKKRVNYFSSSQKGITKLGYEVDAMPMSDEKYPMMLGINPGNTAELSVVFDVGKKDSLQYIEFHDLMFSNGIRIDLTKSVVKK